MIRSVVAAVAALLAVPACAGAAPRAISGYLWYAPSHDSQQGAPAGTLHFTYRTDRPLPERGGFPTTPGPLTDQTTVSRRIPCYDATASVGADGRILGRSGGGVPGSRVRIRVGRDGSVLDRTFTVIRAREGYQRGGFIGCTQDPKARAMYFGLFPTPTVEPVDIFLTANAGPYVHDIGWLRWGTSRAVGRGTFISDCASCGPKVVRGATVVLHARRCPAEGPRAVAYVGTVAVDGRTERIPVGTTLYC